MYVSIVSSLHSNPEEYACTAHINIFIGIHTRMIFLNLDLIVGASHEEEQKTAALQPVGMAGALLPFST